VGEHSSTLSFRLSQVDGIQDRVEELVIRLGEENWNT
jgi:hypothetical protein